LRPAQTACAVRAPGTLASRRSTAAVYWHPGTAQTLTFFVLPASSSHPLVVAEGRFPEASRGMLARQPAGRRILSCFSNASRKHPRRTERRDDNPRQVAVKEFRRCPRKTDGRPGDTR